MSHDWRNDHGISSKSVYRRKFALAPVKEVGGQYIWLKFYYKKYTIWAHRPSNKIFDNDEDYYHRDFNENISEQEYMIRKLAETL